MGESIYIRKQEENAAANAPGQSVLFPTLSGMTLHGGIGQGNVSSSPALDMAIFGAGKGPGNQLFDHAQGTMRQVLDKANALNVAPEVAPRHEQHSPQPAPLSP